jgi:hypothetical protein
MGHVLILTVRNSAAGRCHRVKTPRERVTFCQSVVRGTNLTSLNNWIFPDWRAARILVPSGPCDGHP